MASAAINIQGDGSIVDITTIGGDIESFKVQRSNTGIYELLGTMGMVPPPYGWGVVTNPGDNIKATVLFDNGALTLTIQDPDGKPVDIPSMATLHILLKDAPQVMPPPRPDEATHAKDEYCRRRTAADEAIQSFQDLVDIGEGTAEVESMILEWKRYRVTLNRVSAQPGFPNSIDWPVMPARDGPDSQ